MNSILNIEKKFSWSAKSLIVLFVLLFVLLFAAQSYGQRGVLYGGSAAFFGSTSGSVTLIAPSGLTANYTLTLPVAQATANQFLFDDIGGILKWGTPAAGTGGINFNTAAGVTQLTTNYSSYLFDVEYAPGATGPLPGAVLVAEINDVNNNPSIAEGLDINASNSNVAASGVTLVGIIINVTNAGSGTQIGVQADVKGSTADNNYVMMLVGGNTGIGTATPTEQLEVSGDIRISGTNGLKITEGANGTMGVSAALAANAGGSFITIATTKVTANSRIFLTRNTQAGGVGSAIFVSARVAGTSFTIRSTSTTETSTVAWWIVEP